VESWRPAWPDEAVDGRYTPTIVWELIWLMVIMKIPILYLCWVVYWAVKAEPRPEEPATLAAASDDGPPTVWRTRRRPRRPGPHGHPTRTYARTCRPAVRA
jgi:hypothetical protein